MAKDPIGAKILILHTTTQVQTGIYTGWVAVTQNWAQLPGPISGWMEAKWLHLWNTGGDPQHGDEDYLALACRTQSTGTCVYYDAVESELKSYICQIQM